MVYAATAQSDYSHSSTFVSPTVVAIQLTAARIDHASRPAGASRNHDTRRLHAIAPGLVGPDLGLPRFDGQGWWLGQATCVRTSLRVVVSNSSGVM
jgi:hypothetical protein